MQGDVILQTKSLTKAFGDFVAVKDVNLNVRKGTVHAIIGPNGAGKTTCFNLLTKFLAPTSGEIYFGGRNVTRVGASDSARMGLVRSFQISAIFPALTVMENVRIALQRKRGNSLDFWRSNRCLNVLDAEAIALLEDVGLDHALNSVASSLPYGQRRALEIATTLAMSPKLVLLDEPTAGMGVEDVQRTARLIEQCARDRTVLMVEHNLEVVADLADTITVLVRGQIAAEGDYKYVSNHPIVQEAYIGVESD